MELRIWTLFFTNLWPFFFCRWAEHRLCSCYERSLWRALWKKTEEEVQNIHHIILIRRSLPYNTPCLVTCVVRIFRNNQWEWPVSSWKRPQKQRWRTMNLKQKNNGCLWYGVITRESSTFYVSFTPFCITMLYIFLPFIWCYYSYKRSSTLRMNRYVGYSLIIDITKTRRVEKEKVIGVKALMQGWLTLTNSVNFVRRHIYRKEIAWDKFFWFHYVHEIWSWLFFLSFFTTSISHCSPKLGVVEESHTTSACTSKRWKPPTTLPYKKKTRSLPKMLISFFF